MDKACKVSVGRLQMQVWLGVDLQKTHGEVGRTATQGSWQ